jgi:endonuclease YncB( thermonuclease family)
MSLSALLVSAQAPPPQPALDRTGLSAVRVVDCLDGSRLTVEIGGRTVTVKLLGVKATNPGDRSPSLAQNGAAAKTLLSSLSTGEQVLLDPDQARNPGNVGPRWPKADEHGVLQAHVWRARDALLLNAELLKQGLVFYDSSDQPREEYLRYYSWCQRQANDARLGLWSGEQLVAAGLPPDGRNLLAPTMSDVPSITVPDDSKSFLPDEPAAELTGAVDEAAELPAGLGVDSSSAQLTKRGRRGWDFGWRVELHNDNAKRLRINLTLRFLDHDGYVIGETTQRGISLNAHARKTIRGTIRLKADVGGRATGLSILATKAR